MTTTTLLLGGWMAMAAVMALLWNVQRVRRNAGIVDVAWSLGTAVLGLLFAAFAAGLPARRLVIAVMAGVWGLRLGSYLWRRVMREHEDGRYQALRRQWGTRAQRNLFLFFQAQAVWALMFAVPMLIAATSTRTVIGWPDVAGIVIWIVAIGGEAAADRQLDRFRRDPAARGKVCQVGMWRYSRHPNYFFEWLHWWAYVCLGVAAPGWWVTLLAPLVMLVFLFKITGIPATEARALASRGDAYRAYQRTTSVFVPWPPRKGRPA